MTWLRWHLLPFPIFPKSSYSIPAVVYGSALSASGGLLSGPAALPDFSFIIFVIISSLGTDHKKSKGGGEVFALPIMHVLFHASRACMDFFRSIYVILILHSYFL